MLITSSSHFIIINSERFSGLINRLIKIDFVIHVLTLFVNLHVSLKVLKEGIMIFCNKVGRWKCVCVTCVKLWSHTVSERAAWVVSGSESVLVNYWYSYLQMLFLCIWIKSSWSKVASSHNTQRMIRLNVAYFKVTVPVLLLCNDENTHIGKASLIHILGRK